MKVLPRIYYDRDTKVVARELLGKKLIRRLGDDLLESIIVEVEAYYGPNDPASRAYRGKKSYNIVMWEESGRAFVYNVHNNWLFNIVSHEPDEIGAILIRAVEPSKGIEVMMKNRLIDDVRDLTSGPGKLTKALMIDRTLNGTSLTTEESEVFIVDNLVNYEIGASHRVGVTKDLEDELRFFIKGNRFVSRR